MIHVNYVRDGLIEETHCVNVFGDGLTTVNTDVPYYLRSCAKPLQASLLIDYGVNFTEEEIALCCGSHAGEECHVKIAEKMLKKIGLNESYLKCGVHSPLSRTMQDSMLIKGEKNRSIHNNCSGKHIGFLALCVKNNWDLSDYYEPSHPLQKAVKEKIIQLCEINKDFPETTDGCGVPIQSMPLKNMVIGYKNLLNNYPQIIRAIKNHPYIYGGENRTDTEIIQGTDNLIAKVGAGGLCIVLNIIEKKAFAVKVDDCSYDARKAAVYELIKQLGWGNLHYNNTIRTIQEKIVGKIEVVSDES